MRLTVPETQTLKHSLAIRRSKMGDSVAQSAAVELVLSDDRSLIVHSHRRILPGESGGAWLWVRREVLSTQRVGCSVVMGPVGRGHLTDVQAPLVAEFKMLAIGFLDRKMCTLCTFSLKVEHEEKQSTFLAR